MSLPPLSLEDLRKKNEASQIRRDKEKRKNEQPTPAPGSGPKS